MLYPGRKESKYKNVKVHIVKGIKGKWGTPIFLIDKHGRLLNTEPLCILVEDFHEWFFGWLKKKFAED
ncbi:hypothetical protein ES703_08202 [subsurface metagenome]